MGTQSPLGRLTAMPAREVWPHEAHDFTPWLLQNVDVLSDLLGMDLVLDVAEHPVGDFSLDLKGCDEASGQTVIVENQLETSDHGHLGQIITYAAGTNPQTIVWVAKRFRPEHRAAIDWLNERTDERTRVFGVEINVVRIGDSAPAPNFDLIAQPNDWEKQVRTLTGATSTVSERSKTQRDFWERTLQRIRTEHPNWTRARTSSGPWVNISLGVAEVVMEMHWYREGLVAQIYFTSQDEEVNSRRYEALLAKRADFEEALGETPKWDPMLGKKASRVLLNSGFTDIADRQQWDKAIDWLIDAQVRLREAFEAVGGRATFGEAE